MLTLWFCAISTEDKANPPKKKFVSTVLKSSMLHTKKAFEI